MLTPHIKSKHLFNSQAALDEGIWLLARCALYWTGLGLEILLLELLGSLGERKEGSPIFLSCFVEFCICFGLFVLSAVSKTNKLEDSSNESPTLRIVEFVLRRRTTAETYKINSFDISQ